MRLTPMTCCILGITRSSNICVMFHHDRESQSQSLSALPFSLISAANIVCVCYRWNYEDGWTTVADFFCGQGWERDFKNHGDMLLVQFLVHLEGGQGRIFNHHFTLSQLVWDRILFLACLWCHMAGAFRGISRADIQRDWSALLFWSRLLCIFHFPRGWLTLNVVVYNSFFLIILSSSSKKERESW